MSLASEFRELLAHRDLVKHLVVRDLKVRYKNSALGFFWSLLNPLAQVIIITVIFKFVLQIMRFPNYSAYLLTGFLPWTFFQMAVLDASQSILHHGALLKKVYIPREAIPISIVISNLIHFGLALLVLFAYMVVIGIPFTWKLLLLPVVVLFEFLLTLGVGLLVSMLNVFYDDIKYVMTVALNILYYAVPVIYVAEQVANWKGAPGWLFEVYMLNPLAVWLTAYRQILLPAVDQPGFRTMTLPVEFVIIAALLSVLSAVAGYALFNRYKWRFAEYL